MNPLPELQSSGVPIREGMWTPAGSTRTLFYRLWHPANATVLLVVVHGFGEHGGRYAPVAEAFARYGISVAIPDLWGHGRSGGTRGDQVSFEQYVEDLRAMTSEVFLPATGQGRYAVYGHSFGGLVAIHWALGRVRELDRLVVQSPLLAVGFPIPAWKTGVARWLARHWPAARLAMHLNADALSHDAGVVTAYRRDRLVHNRMSARVYVGALQAAEAACARAAGIQSPTLVLYGEADHIVSVDAVRRWADRLTCQKRVMAFPDMRHELHHEAVREDVLKIVREWVTGAAG